MIAKINNVKFIHKICCNISIMVEHGQTNYFCNIATEPHTFVYLLPMAPCVPAELNGISSMVWLTEPAVCTTLAITGKVY